LGQAGRPQHRAFRTIYNELRRPGRWGNAMASPHADKSGGRGVHVSAAAQQIGGKCAMMLPSTPED